MPKLPGLKSASKMFGNSVSNAAGFAAGVATAPTLAPILEEVRQDAWNLHASRLPDVGALANGVSQGQIDADTAAKWAKRHGFGKDAFAALVNVANTGPGVPAAFDLWRRGVIGEQGFRRAAKRQGLEHEWVDDLVKIKLDVLDQGQLAAAIHRGLIPDPGLLKGEQPGPDRKVEAYPVYSIDAIEEALANGFDRDHLGVLVGLQGLPMGPHEAAQALFRGLITHSDYIAAFNESNSRNEWAQAVLDQARQIPTARDFLENALRGYTNLADALAGAAKHGMSEEDATLIYQNQGRPMTVMNITKALARGGKFKPEPGELQDPYEASIVEGSLKPAYYDFARALRYTQPSIMAIRQLATSGVWAEPKVAEMLRFAGWKPEDAADVAHAWATHGTATADPHVVKAQTQLWTATHRAFVNEDMTETAARDELAAIGADDAARDAVIALWAREREVRRLDLSPSQIKKAYANNVFTRLEAIARLERQGMSAADAAVLLDE